MSLHVFGVRHHGPGCARSLRDALESLQPDIVLVEGPPDADAMIPLAAHDGLKPPVALLVYPTDAPQQAVFYPFAVFSPEWQAIRYAIGKGVPARFVDLPQAVRLARRAQTAEALAAGQGMVEPENGNETTVPSPTAPPPPDPITLLAEAAGYADHELWWEHQVERRRDPAGLFEGIREAMQAVRAEAESPREEEALREAHMRQGIRTAQKEGFERIAVVCGAWHAPVLCNPGPDKVDADLLKGLPRLKVTATWIPWTYSRLSSRSGYGAGIESPGWYHHLWTAPERAPVRWIARAARLMRGEDLDASPASIIEATRLADALAAFRGLRSPGLAELNEAIQAVLCSGEATPMRLVRERLEIDEALGEVPPEAPTVPLRRDLEDAQRRLRLKPTGEARSLDLDLRKDIDRERSRLLHRLHLLGIPWGVARNVSGKSGTFHELWEVRWHPELEVAIVEASLHGNTVAAATEAKARIEADHASDLPALTVLLDFTILAELPAAAEHLIARVQERAAVSADVRALMTALPPLARVSRYGDVRGTRSEQLEPVISGLFERILVGLPGACGSLDEDAARAMADGLAAAQESLDTVARPDLQEEWQVLLRTSLAEADGVHSLVRGFSCRLLLEKQALDQDDLTRFAGLALSPVAGAPQAAAWIEGLLRGSASLLLHQDGLWTALDVWLAGLASDVFTEMLPLLRRAFSSFHGPERRAMGERVKKMAGRGALAPATAGATQPTVELERAAQVLPVLAHILGPPAGRGAE